VPGGVGPPRAAAVGEMAVAGSDWPLSFVARRASPGLDDRPLVVDDLPGGLGAPPDRRPASDPRALPQDVGEQVGVGAELTAEEVRGLLLVLVGGIAVPHLEDRPDLGTPVDGSRGTDLPVVGDRLCLEVVVCGTELRVMEDRFAGCQLPAHGSDRRTHRQPR